MRVGRPSLRAAAGATVVLAALVLAALRAPTVVRSAYQLLTAPGITPTVRELAPAETHDVSTTALLLAAQTIPPNAVYTIVVGKTPPLPGNVPIAVPPLFRYWLLPRRYTPTLADAQWVITYHESSERLGIHYTREIGLGPDANVDRVGR